MRIKEFAITWYGPLHAIERVELGDFNLFYGNNEAGKTLTIDALVKFLAGKKIRIFEDIGRVDGTPEGFVIVDVGNGKELKLPEDGTLEEYVDAPGLRNIFIVRDSDLRIEKEGDFYIELTDRLTGLRTTQISKVIKSLREIASLTNTGQLKNTAENPLRSRFDDAKSLIGNIAAFMEEFRERKYEDLEEKAVKLENRLRITETKIKSLEEAKRRKEYETGRAALKQLKTSMTALEDLAKFTKGDHELWMNSHRNIDDLNEEKGELGKKLNENKSQLEDTEKEYEKLDDDFRILEKRNEHIKNLKNDLKKYEVDFGEQSKRESPYGLIKTVFIVSSILAGLSIVGRIFYPGFLFNIAVFLFTVCFFISLAAAFFIRRGKGKLKAFGDRLLLELPKYGLTGRDVQEALKAISDFETTFETTQNKINKTSIVKQVAKKGIDTDEANLNRIEDRIKAARDAISEIKIKTGVGKLEEFSAKLKAKDEQLKIIEAQVSVLKSDFGKSSDDVNENIRHWEREVNELKMYAVMAKGITYEEGTYRDLQNTREELEKTVSAKRDALTDLKERLKQIENEANRILKIEKDYLRCEAIADLTEVKKELESFVDTVQNNQYNTVEAINIFEAIQTEEEEKVSELFGAVKPVSKHFSKITNGYYEEVLFNKETGMVEVKRKDAKHFTADILSGGTFDQLYLCIRLALGEKLLQGDPGFFIMDDPFVKADPDRLKTQLNKLKEIAKSGWQIIYFSAKGEVRDELTADIEKGEVQYIRMPDIL